MTREQAVALHNPFPFGARYEIFCNSQLPDIRLLHGREGVWLVHPNQQWIDLVAQAPTIKAVWVDKPRVRKLDLSPLSELGLYNFSTSYPSHIRDWSFLSKIPSLKRVVLHNTLSL